MKKIGPLSTDLVVACKVYEYQKNNETVEFGKLVNGLKPLVSKATVLTSLNTLLSWGIVSSEFGETKAGRAGRTYSISGEAYTMVKATYDAYWEKVLAFKQKA